MSTTRRSWLGGAAALSAAAIVPRGALGQGAWPTRPIRIVSPFGVGGSADVLGRMVAARLSPQFGQSIVVENRTGGGGVIGTDHVAKAPADGYTFVMVSNTQVANETLLPNRPYDMIRDLAPVATINLTHHVVVVNPSLPVNSIPELIAYAKANPGRLDYGTPGPGTVHHIAVEVFRARTGIELQHVPFRSSDQVRAALVGGQIPFAFDPIPSMLETVRSGRVRALATTGPQRSAVLPDVPTVAETLPGFDMPVWVGIMAPAGTPGAIIERTNIAINEFLNEPATREAQRRVGAEVFIRTPAEFAAFLRHDIDRHREWINGARITAS